VNENEMAQIYQDMREQIIDRWAFQLGGLHWDDPTYIDGFARREAELAALRHAYDGTALP
jgi:hypothetical protein